MDSVGATCRTQASTIGAISLPGLAPVGGSNGECDQSEPDVDDANASVMGSLDRAVAANPAERFETAEEWLLLFERGEREAISSRPRPLLEREPLAVWRGLALLSLLANLVLLVLLMQG